MKDLIWDVGTNRLSHTKLWSNVAYFMCTIAFGWGIWKGTLTWDIWLIYLGVVAGSTLASKVLSLKFGGNSGK